MKVFRLHKEGTSGQDWFSSTPYSDAVINQIKDPQGDSPKIQITSIPSPFARIDLVKTAFEYVSLKANEDIEFLGEKTIYHKLVADSLDTAEFIFNYKRFKKDLEIVPWEPTEKINQLLKSSNEGHQLLGQTFNTYWNQDKSAYNFDKVQRLYVFKYKQVVIGGTSPVTLFFSAPDINSAVNIKIGNNQLFDNIFDPLYRRDPEFIYYLKVLFEKIAPEFKELMSAFYEYLEINLNYLKQHDNTQYQEFHKRLKNYSKSEVETNYSYITTGTHEDNLEVLKHNFKARKIKEPSDSDFIIASKKYRGKLPLVLQNGYNKPLLYANGTNWNRNFVVPEQDKRPLSERTLPELNIQYPYLTIGDFLEDSLVCLPYRLNSEFFFDGNIESDKDDRSYLLPLKNKFFDFFDSDDLILSNNNDNLFKIVRRAGGNVDVFLKIPIQSGDFIEFKKTYSLNQVKYVVSIGIMPFMQLPRESNLNKYFIQLIDSEADNKKSFDIITYDSSNSPLNTYSRTRTSKEDGLNETKYYECNGEIKYLQLFTDSLKGIIIPKFKKAKYHGNNHITFAIDFGTTNTHIEYSINKGDPTPFEINKEEFFFRSTLDYNNPPRDYAELSEYSRKEFLPSEINRNGGFTFFPIRTALNENERVDYNTTVKAFIDANIAFFYEIEKQHLNEQIHTNLKWAKFEEGEPNRKRLELFFESLIILIRIKTLQNNGNFDEVLIKWLFPSSMLPGRRKTFEDLWKGLINKWISPNAKLAGYTESIAPFYYFKENTDVSATAYPVSAIDIGGETTDIVVFEDNKPKFITSFRYAANSIFGDGYGGRNSNGFVIKYKDHFSGLFKANQELGFDYHRIYSEIAEKKSSPDIISFFFSLENIRKLSEIEDLVNFDRILNRDNELKIVFILFYSSIIYHLAKLMRATGMKFPRYLTFSGNGAKVLNILEGENVQFTHLSRLTHIIFEKIYSKKINKFQVEIKLPEEPKVITCKGCIEDKDIIPLNTTRNVYLLNDKLIDESENLITYEDIDIQNEQFINNVKADYLAFIDFLFKLNSEHSFNKYFSIPANKIKEYRKILSSEAEIESYFKEALINKYQEIGNDKTQNIEETTFFYILHGMLNKLGKEIVMKR